MHYYQRLRDIREDNDLKQDSIAEKLGMTRQQYQLYESGKREIPFHSAIEFAELFGVSIDYIAGRTNNKRINDVSGISEEERAMISKYRSLSSERRGRIAERLEMLSEEEWRSSEKKKKHT